jgi:hypothetical protein
MSYTIEDFQIEIRKTETAQQMSEVIEKLLDSPNIDVKDPNVKEIILEYRAQLEDYRKDVAAEEDKYCNDLIESDKCELYICKNDIQWFKSGNRYHVRFDDTKSQYLENIKDIIDRLQPEVIEKLTSMKPLIWVISDNGIGTLKSRHLFTRQDGEIFEDYFEKA